MTKTTKFQSYADEMIAPVRKHWELHSASLSQFEGFEQFVAVMARRVPASAMYRSGVHSLVTVKAKIDRALRSLRDNTLADSSTRADYREACNAPRESLSGCFAGDSDELAVRCNLYGLLVAAAVAQGEGERAEAAQEDVQEEEVPTSPEFERERQKVYSAEHRNKSKAIGRPDGRVIQAAYFDSVEKMLAHCVSLGDETSVRMLTAIINNALKDVIRAGYDEQQVRDKRKSMTRLRQEEIQGNLKPR